MDADGGAEAWAVLLRSVSDVSRRPFLSVGVVILPQLQRPGSNPLERFIVIPLDGRTLKTSSRVLGSDIRSQRPLHKEWKTDRVASQASAKSLG
jgi:hypothetical protein